MNETTRKETIAAVREIYAKRLKLIDCAIRAAEAARNHGTFSLFFEHGIENFRLARKQTEIDFDNQIKYWEELE